MTDLFEQAEDRLRAAIDDVAKDIACGTLTSDDVDEPTLTVDLSGAGFDPGEISILVDADGNTIVGDFDASATVNFDDFFIFADNFGQAVFTPATDLDASGAVNFDDFFIFADNFGKTGTYVGG